MLTLPVASLRRATPHSLIVRLALEGHTFAYRAGQSALIGRHGQPDRRHYSLATPPEMATAHGQLEFLVRTETDGRAGPHLEGLRKGVMLDVEGPVGRFKFPDQLRDPACLFIAGGTGIAPIRAMLLHAHARYPRAELRLVYSARSSREFAYLPALRSLARGGRLRLALTATRDAARSFRGGRGRLTQAQLAPHVRGDALAFVCGPPALVEAVPGMLMKLGVPEGKIRTEIW